MAAFRHARSHARVAALALLAGLAGARGQAATFVTDSAADAVDAAPGDGTCATAAGACTLRAAVQEANALPRPDAITLPAGVYTLTLIGNGEQAAAIGDLDVSDELAVTGAGAAVTVIDGAGGARVFEVVGATSLTVTDLTIRNGNATGDGGCGVVSGGGGAVCNAEGTVTIVRSTLAGNRGTFGGGLALGTASMPATATVVDSTLTGNSATQFAGGGFLVGNGTLTVSGTTITAGMTSLFGGAGLWVTSPGTVTLRNSTMSDNPGGGILSITLCDPRDGCVLYAGTVHLQNVTITDPIQADANTVTARNTIVAGSCQAPLVSEGHNLGRTPFGCLGPGAPGDVLVADPGLGPLAENGGPTRTHALRPGSPAADAGSPGAPGSEGACEAADQRGRARPVGGRCDIGAYEGACGNGLLDPDEACDDGDTPSGDGCDANCTPTACGNGIVTAGEECDDGAANGTPTSTCTADCRAAVPTTTTSTSSSTTSSTRTTTTSTTSTTAPLCTPERVRACDDGDFCTDDTCEPATGACRHAARPAGSPAAVTCLLDGLREALAVAGCAPRCRCALVPRPDQVARVVAAATRAPGTAGCRRRLRDAAARAAVLRRRLGQLVAAGCLARPDAAGALTAEAVTRARALARSGYCAAR